MIVRSLSTCALVASAAACHRPPPDGLAPPTPSASVAPTAAPPPSETAILSVVLTNLDVVRPHRYDVPDAVAPWSLSSTEEMGEWRDLVAWGQARRANARAGAPELVRIPIHHHGVGWGCTCPWHYVGIMEFSSEEGLWLDPHYEPTAAPIAERETKIVEGYFTGESHPEKGDGTTKYDVLDFRVLRSRAATSTVPGAGDVALTDARAVVLAQGNQAGLETAPPSDGRTFLVVVASIPLSSPRALESARAEADRLRGSFPRVEVIDSRTVPGLFCCNYVVVLDRARSERDVAEVAAEARKLGSVSVRRGW